MSNGAAIAAAAAAAIANAIKASGTIVQVDPICLETSSLSSRRKFGCRIEKNARA